MCEGKMVMKSEDGLCAPCHIQLCLNQDTCNRCMDIFNRVTEFIDEEEDEDEEEEY